MADEITASLDAVTQAQIWQLLLARAQEEKIGVLAISHDRPLLEEVAGRIVEFEDLTAQ